MSDENLEVPEHLRKGMTAAQRASLDSASSASMKVPRISVRGKTFRVNENGEEVRKRDGFMDVIVLGVVPDAGNNIKTFYEAGYVPGANSPPDCASDDGLRPSPWVSKKQSDNCKTCKWNQFGSATSPSGKKTKKCRDSKRLWVIDQTDWGVDGKKNPIKPEIAFEDEPVYGLGVSVSGLQSLAECGRHLQAMGVAWPYAKVRLSFADAEYPQLEFKVVGFVTPAQLPYVEKQSEAQPWKMFSTQALSAPDEAPGSSSSLPGLRADGSDVPAHIRAASGAVQDVAVKPGTTEGVKGGDVDSAIADF
jgi:hypothetical protein